jgi:RNA-directed DNA polymerase
MLSGHGKSDNSIVPRKFSNKVCQRAAERMEGRELAKGRTLEQTTLRTQSREGVPSALERIREAVQKDRKQRFTALLHHVYAMERLRESYFRLKREATPGIDGETWRH